MKVPVLLLLWLVSNVAQFVSLATFPMGMEENSVAYRFSHDTKSDDLAINHLDTEMAGNADYKSAMKQAKDNLMNHNLPSGLLKEQMWAVNAYTLEKPSFYKEFNAAVSKWGKDVATYNAKFNYKSFHYLLSTALQKLLHKQDQNQNQNVSPTLYRGMSVNLDGNVNQPMRFGRFASTTTNMSVAKEFGTGTLLTLTSKLAVKISLWSMFANEEEWLIPPEEVFNVTDAKKGNGVWTYSLSPIDSKFTRVALVKERNQLAVTNV